MPPLWRQSLQLTRFSPGPLVGLSSHVTVGGGLVQDPLRASPVQTGIKIPVLSLSQAVGDKVTKAQCKPQSSVPSKQAVQ